MLKIGLILLAFIGLVGTTTHYAFANIMGGPSVQPLCSTDTGGGGGGTSDQGSGSGSGYEGSPSLSIPPRHVGGSHFSSEFPRGSGAYMGSAPNPDGSDYHGPFVVIGHHHYDNPGLGAWQHNQGLPGSVVHYWTHESYLGMSHEYYKHLHEHHHESTNLRTGG